MVHNKAENSTTFFTIPLGQTWEAICRLCTNFHLDQDCLHVAKIQAWQVFQHMPVPLCLTKKGGYYVQLKFYCVP